MPATPFSHDAATAGRAFGAMLFTFFGAVLMEVWDRRAGAGPVFAVAIALLGVALLLAAWLRYRRHAPALASVAATPERKRADRVFNIVNIGQWVVIIVAGNVMVNLGWGEWVVPMAIGVIGLHFLPLAHVFRNPSHHVLGAVLILFAVLYPQVAPGGPADPVGFLGTGLILWCGALWALRRTTADQ